MRSDNGREMGSPSPSSIMTGRVLLVDENSHDLRYHRLLLEGQGYDVLTCHSFEVGTQHLEREPFDFVIIDQGTSAFEGKKLVERALQLDRHRAVLVTAACADTTCYLDAMQMGAVDYMEKPLAPRVFLPLVRAHVRRDKTKMQGAG